MVGLPVLAPCYKHHSARVSPSGQVIPARPAVPRGLSNAPAGTLGERVLACRCLLGISQKELAQRLGIDPSTLG
ncbi:MAG: helix-turn-helix domain-containing protein [Anaerolineae bacterium]